jgi:hypothetical protein
MNSVCESHIPPADKKSVAAGGNCAAAMQGGEQPEAEVRSQIGLPRPVNSIRWLRGASLLGNERSLPPERRTTDGPRLVNAGPCRRSYSWSENASKGSWVTIRELPWCQEESTVAVRASIRAMKWGNARGAKGRRKMKRTKLRRGYTTANIAERLTLAELSSLRGTARFVGGHPGDGVLGQQDCASAIFSLALPPHLEPPPESGTTRRSESRVREIRLHGSEGGAGPIPVPTPIIN